MEISSLKFKQLCVKFSSNLQDIEEDLYEAMENDLQKTELINAINAAKKKLKQFEDIKARLDKPKRNQFCEEYGERIDDLHALLNKLL